MDNTTAFDYIGYLASQGIEDAREYFDANRDIKMKDRLPMEVHSQLDMVVKRLRKACQDTTPQELMKTNNQMLL